jgi:membrane-associated phospholipid phosphatase
MLITGLMVDRLDLTLSETVSVYAMVGIAAGEAFISAWEAKYRYMLLRPVTYINRNIRRSWGPLIQSPPFPEYPSGHSVVSGAAAAVLTDFFGQVAYTDDSGLPREILPRSFTSFESAATEAAISRMYGGIHYRVAIENGLAQGRCVANAITDRIRLIPFLQE